jgi:mRNA interferase RelE/StbE
MYELIIDKKVTKYTIKQDKPTQKRIKDILLELAENPFSPKLDIVKLIGYKVHYRVRIGDIRIIYEVKNKELIIHVLDINNRGQIYKRWT